MGRNELSEMRGARGRFLSLSISKQLPLCIPAWLEYNIPCTSKFCLSVCKYYNAQAHPLDMHPVVKRRGAG